jgi:diaminopimelate epimerase
MIFYKTSSFGNDFIEIELSRLKAGSGYKGTLVREICDRQRGVGADGVVFYRVAGRKAALPGDNAPEKAALRGYHFLRGSSCTRVSASPGGEKRRIDFQIFNRDGGEAELSGNGMAGLAAVVFQRRLAASPLELHAAIGPRRVELLGREGAVFRLSVEIGLPDFSARNFFPFLKDGQASYAIDGLEFHPVSVGNPHAVVIGREMPPAEQLIALGKKIEGHAMFPKRVNVEFVLRTGDDSCRVFFYERGVGPTQASSTGSAAVFAVLRRHGLAGDRLLIDLDPAGKEVGSHGAVYPAGANPAGKEVGSHGAVYPAGGGHDKIALHWHEGIFIDNVTRLICRGNYFG